MMFMTKYWLGGFAALALLVFTGYFADLAYADPQPDILPPGPLDEQSDSTIGGLRLLDTVLQTKDNGFYVLPTPQDAFSPTTVLCRRNCVLRIEVASQFWLVPENQVAQMVVKVDDSRVGVKPYFNINVDPTTTGETADTRTFSWVREGLSPGEHTVDVEFRLSGLIGKAGAGYRTLTIEVYQQRRSGGFKGHTRGEGPVGEDPVGCIATGDVCAPANPSACCSGLCQKQGPEIGQCVE